MRERKKITNYILGRHPPLSDKQRRFHDYLEYFACPDHQLCAMHFGNRMKESGHVASLCGSNNGSNIIVGGRGWRAEGVGVRVGGGGGGVEAMRGGRETSKKKKTS